MAGHDVQVQPCTPIILVLGTGGGSTRFRVGGAQMFGVYEQNSVWAFWSGSHGRATAKTGTQRFVLGGMTQLHDVSLRDAHTV